MNRIFVTHLKTSYSRLLARHAAVILTEDDAIPDEPIVLYGRDAGETMNVLMLCLEEGDSLFESTNLRAAVEFVKEVKGRCEFAMSHEGLPIEEEEAPVRPDCDCKPGEHPEDDCDWRGF